MSICRFFCRSILAFSSLILVRSLLGFLYLFTSFSSNLEFLFNEAVVQEVVLVCDILNSICIVTYKPIKSICKLVGLCMYVLI